MTPWQWFITGLAVWRISSLLVHEDGPGRVFFRLRLLAGRASPTFFWQLLQCVWCTSVWIGAGFLALWFLLPGVAEALALWLSLSAMAVAWQQVCRNDIGNEWLRLTKGVKDDQE